MHYPRKWHRCHPPCVSVLVVGTDGKVNLANPLLNIFRSALHLLCDIHMKDNIKSKLSSLGVPNHVVESTCPISLDGERRLASFTAWTELDLIKQ